MKVFVLILTPSGFAGLYHRGGMSACAQNWLSQFRTRKLAMQGCVLMRTDESQEPDNSYDADAECDLTADANAEAADRSLAAILERRSKSPAV